MQEGIQDKIASVAASRPINVIQSCSLVGNKYKKVSEISEHLGFGCVERICHKSS